MSDECGYLFVARCILFAYGPTDATAIPTRIISCLIYVQTDFNFDTSLPRSQWRKYNFCLPPANICYGLTVLILNSGHFGPPLPFWAPSIAEAADG